MSEKRFPILGGGSIPWELAEAALAGHLDKYFGGQSVEQLASRGGVAPSELDPHLPKWREMAADLKKDKEIARLKARLKLMADYIEGAAKFAGQIAADEKPKCTKTAAAR